MLTYSFENRGSQSLYEYLYKRIRDDIVGGKLKSGDKLPSKRAFAKHLDISTITVENAYAQLMAEGYIYSQPKSGYYVSSIIPSYMQEWKEKSEYRIDNISSEKEEYSADFAKNSASNGTFPFSTWAKVMRETLTDNPAKLMIHSPSVGVSELRIAIANYLFQFRGMNVDPDRIIIGAGTEYLYSLIIQLLGFDKKYAVEDPGYRKIAEIYKANNVSCLHIPIDDKGIDVEALEKSEGDVLHISPSHHFPTGIVTPVSRRYEILSWASKSKERYIIEDDYDSEFRLLGKPIPSLQSIDALEKVIYINTFSKSLTPTIRISYMVLPESLMEVYRNKLSFYSCTVSTFEQYTLANFISKGYFEKHINRMRNFYRSQRDIIMKCIKRQPEFKRVSIKEENAGLHFILSFDTELSDDEIIMKARQNGINLSCLSQYFYNKENSKEHAVIINYSGIETEDIEKYIPLLFGSVFQK